MVESDIVEQKLREWTHGKDPREARVAIYYRIRDIPYAALAELRDPNCYADILRLNAGSCTPKHILLGKMYESIGLEVLYAVYPFRWSEFSPLYPGKLKRLAEDMPIASHLACKVNINGRLTLVDATLDLALGKFGFPVNHQWDGESGTSLAVVPCSGEELYHSSEVFMAQTGLLNERALAFYNALNRWLGELRQRLLS